LGERDWRSFSAGFQGERRSSVAIVESSDVDATHLILAGELYIKSVE
jgi:hypothetical protein